MTIAELFVKVGFQVDNPGALNKAASELGFAEVKAINLKRSVLALGASFTALIYFASNAGTALFKFHIATGLSAQTLQRWQLAAAKANVSGEAVVQSVKSIQDAQVQIALGQGNLAPWALLGIDPRQNPFDVLWQLHLRLQNIAPAMGRYLASQMGVPEEMYTLLKRADLTVDQLQGKIVSDDEAEKLDKVNGDFNVLVQNIKNMGISFAAANAGTITDFFSNIQPYILEAAKALEAFTANTPNGAAARRHFKMYAEGILAIVAALSALSFVAKGVATLSALGGFFGLVRAAAKGAAAVAGDAVGTTGGVIGGINAGLDAGLIAGAPALAATAAIGSTPFAMAKLMQWADKKAEDDARARGASPEEIKNAVDSVSAAKAFGMLGKYLTSTPAGGNFSRGDIGGPSPRNTYVTVQQNINGSRDPVAVGQASAVAIKKVMSDANAAYINQAPGGYIY